MTATHLRISPGTRRFCSCPSRVEASGPCWSASCWPTRTRSRGTPAAECPRSSCLRRRRRRRRGIKLGEERAGGCVSALERERGRRHAKTWRKCENRPREEEGTFGRRDDANCGNSSRKGGKASHDDAANRWTDRQACHAGRRVARACESVPIPASINASSFPRTGI